MPDESDGENRMNMGESRAEERYIFGGYEILETTGTGGMGIVYRAHDIALDRVVALKILRDDLRAHANVVARFQREAEACAKLDHPHIVHLYSVGKIGAIPYIAMEFIEGTALSKLLQRHGPMNWRKALEIGAQMADALACAHDAQIIHRDMKPGNILIDNDWHAYITDFGIAKVLTATTQLTMDGARLGTPQYMCPERCQNKKITTASDIYSLGALLFQCISGRLPFEARNSVDLIKKISSGRPRRLSEFVPDIPEPVERLIAYMIEKNPKDRPSDARVVYGAIDRVLKGKALDEHADELASTIASYRKSVGPETPSSESVEEPLLGRLSKRWFAASRVVRVALAFLVIATISVPLSLFVYTHFIASPFLQADYGPELGVARWGETPPLAVFFDETPGVQLSNLAFPDFHIAQILWAGGSSGAIIHLNGAPGTSREEQHSVVTLNPSRHAAVMSLSPFSLRRGHDFNLLAGSVSDTGESVYFIADGLKTMASYPAQGGVPRVILPYSVGALAAHPRSARIAVSHPSDTTSGEWTLSEMSISPRAEVEVLVRCETPVTQIAYSGDGSRLAYVRENSQSGRELWLAPDKKVGRDGSLLLRGNIVLGARPFHQNGETLVLTRSGADGDTSLELIDVDSGDMVADLGPAARSLWYPSQNYLLVSAADRAGRVQLWAVNARAPYQRQQLTHLGTGIVPTVMLDGEFALTAMPNTATIVIVALPDNPF